MIVLTVVPPSSIVTPWRCILENALRGLGPSKPGGTIESLELAGKSRTIWNDKLTGFGRSGPPTFGHQVLHCQLSCQRWLTQDAQQVPHTGGRRTRTVCAAVTCSCASWTGPSAKTLRPNCILSPRETDGGGQTGGLDAAFGLLMPLRRSRVLARPGRAVASWRASFDRKGNAWLRERWESRIAATTLSPFELP